MHSEAKQTKMLEFETEKGLLQGLCKVNGQLVLKRPKFPDGFQGRVFIGKIWGEGCRVCNLPQIVGSEVTGWYSRNLDHQSSGSNQSGVHMHVLSLKLPSSTWVGGLVPVEELRDTYQIVMYIT